MTTTLNQMFARMHSGHVAILQATRDGKTLRKCTYGDIKAMGTLNRWGAIADGEITGTGLELLARWDQQKPSQRRIRPVEIEWEAPTTEIDF